MNRFAFAFATLVFCFLLNSEARADWKRDDPACVKRLAPSLEKNPERFLVWLGGCIDDNPPDFTLPGWGCSGREGFKYLDAQGTCWQATCGGYGILVWKPCIEPKNLNLLTGIVSVTIELDGSLVEIKSASGKLTRQKFKPSRLKPLPLIRAMVNQVRLPSNDLFRIRDDFWSSLSPVHLSVVGTFTKN